MPQCSMSAQRRMPALECAALCVASARHRQVFQSCMRGLSRRETRWGLNQRVGAAFRARGTRQKTWRTYAQGVDVADLREHGLRVKRL